MKARILLIEDHDDSRYMVGFLLRQAGHEILEAGTGTEGIRLLRQAGADLVLFEVRLPDMDGRELPTAADPGPAWVALTAFVTPEDRRALLEAGCAGILEKPIDPDTFVQTIENYLGPGPPS